MKRSDARKEVMSLCFEYAFKNYQDAEEIYSLALETREFGSDPYIRETFMGITENLAFIDAKIGQYANGWTVNRISPVAMAVMRTAVYEMYFRDDIPDLVSLNEALNLVKEYDDPKLTSFVNGILNAVQKEHHSEIKPASPAEGV